MGVRLHYAGTVFDLAPEHDGHDVTNSLLRRANHVFLKSGRPEFRDDPLVEGDLEGLQPWATFRLIDGGEISVWVHDRMEIVVEDSEGDVVPLTKAEIAMEPFQ
ncbi:hypothetical protein ACUXNS_000087 [Brevibacterium pityocampae]